MLLPAGFARTATLLGEGCPPALRPGAGHVDGPADLVVVAPARRDDAQALVREAAQAVASDGVVVVLAAGLRRRSMVRKARASGLFERETFLHIPSAKRPRFLASDTAGPVRHALAALPRTSLRRRAAVLAGRVPGWAMPFRLGRSSAVLTGASTRPLLEWLGGGIDPSDILVQTSREQGAEVHVVRALDAGVVAKIGRGAVDRRREFEEWEALERVAPSGRAAGVDTPVLIRRTDLGGTPAFVESAVSGRPASIVLAEHPGKLAAIVDGLATWLRHWHEENAARAALTSAVIEQELLEPARRLAADLPVGYLERLEQLSARADGTSMPFVPSHGDLTMANVLVDDDGGLGVVDWSSARSRALPLTDFLYAVADAQAASSGYEHRTDAFRRCFVERAGRERTRELLSRVAEPLTLDRTAVEVAFHACWLHHAANEADRVPAWGRPFLELVRVASSTEPLR